MKEFLYQFIEKNFKKKVWKCIRKRNGILFLKDSKNGFFLHIYQIIRDTFLCNGFIIKEGKYGKPFFLDPKEQFICNIFYDEETNHFQENDMILLFSFLYKYYLKLYILPVLPKEKIFSLQVLSFYQISTLDLRELQKYFIFIG